MMVIMLHQSIFSDNACTLTKSIQRIQADQTGCGARTDFKVLHTLAGEKISKDWAGLQGRISRDLQATEGLRRPAYYLCGTPSMVTAGSDLLHRMGVPKDDANYEVFRGLLELGGIVSNMPDHFEARISH
jgi:ferredoxin-NADP reductase